MWRWASRVQPYLKVFDMKRSRLTIPIWTILSAALIPVTALSGILAAIILDALVDRPEGGGSVTTLLPGVAYGTALVMKVCLVEGVILLPIVLVGRVLRLPRRTIVATDARRNNSDSPGKKFPIWSVLSVVLIPLAPLFAAVAVVIVQALIDKPEGISLSYIPRVARTGVLTMLACIAAGVLAAVVALVQRECPRTVPLFGLITNAFLIGMFRHFEFYKLGFDQDRWSAP